MYLVCLRILQIFQRPGLYFLPPLTHFTLLLPHRDTQKMINNIWWYLWSAVEQRGTPTLQGAFTNVQSSPDFRDGAPAKGHSLFVRMTLGMSEKKISPYWATVFLPLVFILDLKSTHWRKAKHFQAHLPHACPLHIQRLLLNLSSWWKLLSVTWLNFSVIQFSLFF